MTKKEFLRRCILNKPITNTDGLKQFISEYNRVGKNINQIALVANATEIIDAGKYDERYRELIELTVKLIKATELPIEVR